MYGHFAGINRKVQLKYLPHGLDRRSSDSEVPGGEPAKGSLDIGLLDVQHS